MIIDRFYDQREQATSSISSNHVPAPRCLGIGEGPIIIFVQDIERVAQPQLMSGELVLGTLC